MSDQLILVTGAGGFMGEHLCRQLTDSGKRVLAQVLPGERAPACEAFVEADVRSPDDLAVFTNYDIEGIYHLAGSPSIPLSVADPRRDFEINAVGTFNTLELAGELDLDFFVFASTLSVLDPRNDLPLDETARHGPSSPYGAAKMAGEAYCMAYWKCYQTPTRVVRASNIYGPGKIRSTVVHDVIGKLMVDPKRLEIFRDGSQVRCFLHVDDAVAGMQIAAEAGSPGEVYHVGSGQPVSILELIEVIIDQLNLTDVEIVSAGESWKGDIRRWYADPTKLKSLGFAPQIDLPTGVAETIEWVRQVQLEACE